MGVKEGLISNGQPLIIEGKGKHLSDLQPDIVEAVNYTRASNLPAQILIDWPGLASQDAAGLQAKTELLLTLLAIKGTELKIQTEYLGETVLLTITFHDNRPKGQRQDWPAGASHD
ncbi:MAG: hypothetical protein V1763_00310 [Parcubacteria group bacterium]